MASRQKSKNRAYTRGQGSVASPGVSSMTSIARSVSTIARSEPSIPRSVSQSTWAWNCASVPSRSCLNPRPFNWSTRSITCRAPRERRLLSVRSAFSFSSRSAKLAAGRSLGRSTNRWSMRRGARWSSEAGAIESPSCSPYSTSTRARISSKAGTSWSRVASSSRAALVNVKTRKRGFSPPDCLATARHRWRIECVLPLPAGARSRTAVPGSEQNFCWDESSHTSGAATVSMVCRFSEAPESWAIDVRNCTHAMAAKPGIRATSLPDFRSRKSLKSLDY